MTFFKNRKIEKTNLDNQGTNNINITTQPQNNNDNSLIFNIGEKLGKLTESIDNNSRCVDNNSKVIKHLLDKTQDHDRRISKLENGRKK